eukprot:Phypoly_transcript_04188.p1 GENE.Phypoly_transcript_04188~~Phypoly_transcript_04188.p1  ORF type:complete len:416 (-),score=56.06 Phypoly_transcript_04188:1000-2196(-)
MSPIALANCLSSRPGESPTITFASLECINNINMSTSKGTLSITPPNNTYKKVTLYVTITNPLDKKQYHRPLFFQYSLHDKNSLNSLPINQIAKKEVYVTQSYYTLQFENKIDLPTPSYKFPHLQLYYRSSHTTDTTKDLSVKNFHFSKKTGFNWAVVKVLLVDGEILSEAELQLATSPRIICEYTSRYFILAATLQTAKEKLAQAIKIWPNKFPNASVYATLPKNEGSTSLVQDTQDIDAVNNTTKRKLETSLDIDQENKIPKYANQDVSDDELREVLHALPLFEKLIPIMSKVLPQCLAGEICNDINKRTENHDQQIQELQKQVEEQKEENAKLKLEIAALKTLPEQLEAKDTMINNLKQEIKVKTALVKEVEAQLHRYKATTASFGTIREYAEKDN